MTSSPSLLDVISNIREVQKKISELPSEVREIRCKKDETMKEFEEKEEKWNKTQDWESLGGKNEQNKIRNFTTG